MTNRFAQIGIDRLIRLRWLEQTASLALTGNDVAAVKSAIREELQPEFPTSDANVRGSLDKTITILMKIWARVPSQLEPLHEEGLRLFLTLPKDRHIALHWGMTMAVYPFWGAVAQQVGRLVHLQESFEPRQIQRRLRELYGERETVSRRVRYLLRSYVDWGVLRDKTKGVYIQGDIYAIQQPELIAWMTEAYLNAQPNGKASIREILNSPSLFPFRLAPFSADAIVARSPRLELLRHGLDDELIMLEQ